jgi:urease accessory protein
MGASPARITAADFVTPPELARWRLADAAAGRIGGVRVELAAGPGGAHLGDCYQQVPLRVLPPFRFSADRPSLLYLLNPTAGLLDGDGQLIELTARAGTRTVVVGQSATRIHPSLRHFSTQQWRLRVEAGATLVVLPGPAIPFQGSRYYQRVVIDLDPAAALVWGDIWVAGRYARGGASELFQFAMMVQELTVRREGRLVFRDRFCWRGPWGRDTARWHFGEGMGSGSLFVSGPGSDAVVADSAAVDQASFVTAAGDRCLRWCGSSEAVIGSVVDTALRAAAVLEGSAVADDWLIHQDLAPVHWFSFPRTAR